MVIGDGLIGRAFAGYAPNRQVVIFAAGVADSLEARPEPFARERALLEATRARFPDATLVYFSTCSIADPDRVESVYVRHKLAMESLLGAWDAPHLVLRLPAVMGHTRRASTLPYHFLARIQAGQAIDVWTHAVRYPICIDHAVAISKNLIDHPGDRKSVNNVALRPYRVTEMLDEMERFLGRSVPRRYVARGGGYDFDRQVALRIADRLGIDYGVDYFQRMLQKYFGEYAAAPGTRQSGAGP